MNWQRVPDLAARLGLLVVLTSGTSAPAATIADGAGSLGADYAFLSLLALSPDLAAANYTFSSDTGPDVDVAIYRLPFHRDLMKGHGRRLQFEGGLAYQTTHQRLPTYPGEYIDSRWTVSGIGMGLLYEEQIADHLQFTPSLRLGVAHMVNRATYNGALTALLRDQFDGTLLNWNTNILTTSLGLGLVRDWQLGDRTSRLVANVYRARADSFHESSPAIRFSEPANMLAVSVDAIVPTRLTLSGERLDLVLMGGTNGFFGENRDTLGYTVSYQVGVGGELPLHWLAGSRGHVRLSAQFLAAENMRGWLATVGYNPE